MTPVERTVVGAIITDAGRVLAARRTYPPDLAGLWEFPGGKVESGELPEAALKREVAEELDCRIEVTAEVESGPWRISDTYVLRLFVTTLIEGQPKPGRDHDLLRWLDLGDVESVDWLPSDRAALRAVQAGLGVG